MKRPCPRRRCLVLLAFLMLPPVCWALVLAITPTEWARTRIVARLGRATGRPVQLQRLTIGVLGGIRLTDLRIGAPGRGDDPWLRVDSARVNMSVLQLLAGHAEPSVIDVEGCDLRVLRRPDGTFELVDLLLSHDDDLGAASHSNHAEPPALEVRLRDAKVHVIDEPNGTRLELAALQGRATWQGRHLSVHELRGTLNGGPFDLVASLDRTQREPAFEVRFRGRSVALGAGTDVLDYLVPVLARAPEAAKAIEGRLDLNVYVRGHGTSRAALKRSLAGQGALTIDPLSVDGSRVMTELVAQLGLAGPAKVGSVKSEFTIKDGRIWTENLTLNAGGMPVVLAGWTDFDGRIDYRLRADRLADRLPGQARDLLSNLSIDLGAFAACELKGRLDGIRLIVDRDILDPLAKDGGLRRGDGRTQFRDIGRRLRDRILR